MGVPRAFIIHEPIQMAAMRLMARMTPSMSLTCKGACNVMRVLVKDAEKHLALQGNSAVLHPILINCLECFASSQGAWKAWEDTA